jgi:signal transduction histidine kinase
MTGDRRPTTPRPADVIVVGTLMLATAGLWYEDYRSIEARPVAALGLRLAAVLPLAWLRIRPWPVLLAVSGAQIVSGFVETGDSISQGPLFVAIAVYGVACYAPAPRSMFALPVGGGAILIALLLSLSGAGGPRARGPVVLVMALVLASAVVGVAWLLGHGRRRIVGDARRLRQLAEQLRAEQEISERRAVHAERARVAADLHDIVAHHVSAIAVQARATADVLADGGNPAGDRLSEIAATADSALVEMRRMLRLLVDPQDPALHGEPSLAHLDRLTRVAETAGCRVAVHVDPAVTATPDSMQICAYRIIQEALTNVVKHASATAVEVDLRCDSSSLTVTIENAPPPPAHRPVEGSGLGIVGMRERVTVFGGDLYAGPRGDGGWRVTATLPTGAEHGFR